MTDFKEDSSLALERCPEHLPLEILVRIFDFVPGKCLRVCRQVCNTWKVASNIALSKELRRCPVGKIFFVWLPTRASKESSYLEPIKDFLDETMIDVGTAIILNEISCTMNYDKALCQSLVNAINLQVQAESIPHEVNVIGCTVKSAFGPRNAVALKSTIQNSLERVNQLYSAGVLLIPKSDQYLIRNFHIPMKKKYEMIKGFKHFLPCASEETPLVLMFIHPVTLGRLSHLIDAIRRVYSKKTCIIGIYSETCIYSQKLVTSNEIVGLAFSGDVKCFSTIIDKETFSGDPKEKVKQLSEMSKKIPGENHYAKVIFIFAPPCIVHEKMLLFLSAIKQAFQGVQVFAGYTCSVFGANHNMDDTNGIAGGRDYLQTQAVLFCLVMLSKKTHS